MKLLPIILALAFFKLTVLPTCTTDMTCCSKIENTIGENDSEEEPKDCCSDCTCIHTGYTTMLSEITLRLDSSESNLVTCSYDYNETYHHLYISQEWHPPLYS